MTTTRHTRARNRKRRDAGEAGFTMVELLVVLAIIVLVASLAAPQVLRYLGSARSDAAIAQIKNIEGALDLFFIDNLRYPTSEEGLKALSEPSPELQDRWNGPYLKKADEIVDPWGRPYRYSADSDTVQISSLGRDGKEGGTGEDADISN
ncbi:MAG: type II secretion system major pseudopilin GspG [Nitratireductor sp.]|nr:type II secretion system major pseudopilin GspG [Nitratireductor sp.]